jgi:hypothetical protein
VEEDEDDKADEEGVDDVVINVFDIDDRFSVGVVFCFAGGAKVFLMIVRRLLDSRGLGEEFTGFVKVISPGFMYCGEHLY